MNHLGDFINSLRYAHWHHATNFTRMVVCLSRLVAFESTLAEALRLITDRSRCKLLQWCPGMWVRVMRAEADTETALLPYAIKDPLTSRRGSYN